MKALSVGAPGQLEVPTAPENWMLQGDTSELQLHLYIKNIQVSNAHSTPLLERPEALDNLIQANVGVEFGLDVREDHDGAVGSSTTASRLLDEIMC